MNTPDPERLIAALERRDAENHARRTDAQARFQAQEGAVSSGEVDGQLSDAEVASNRTNLRASLILTAIVGGVFSISAIRDLVKAATGGATLQDAPVATMNIEPYDPDSNGGEEVFMDAPDAPFGADGRAGTADDNFPKLVAIVPRRTKMAVRQKLSGGWVVGDGEEVKVTLPEKPTTRESFLSDIRIDLVREFDSDGEMNIKSMY